MKETIILITSLLFLGLPGLAEDSDSSARAKWDSMNSKLETSYSHGKYQEAIKYGQEAKQLAKEQFGETDTNYTTTLNNLGILYHRLGRYKKSKALYEQVKAIRKKMLGKEHPKYGVALNNLAALYEVTGRFEEAELLYRQALAIRKKSFGKEHPKYANTLTNLGALYYNMGLFEKAESLFQKANTINKNTLGENDPSYATSLNNLGALYQRMDRYKKAKPLFEQSHSIYKKTLGKNHHRYALSIDGLGACYRAKGHYKKAEPLHKQAMKIRKKSLGKDHPTYAQSLINVAITYEYMEKYQQVRPLLEKALSIRQKTLGKDHPEYGNTLNRLAGLHQQTGRYREAISYYRKTRTNVINRIDKMFGFLSEQGKTNFLNMVEDKFEQFQSFTALTHDSIAGTASIAYNNELLLKGLVLSQTRNMRQAIRQEADSSLMTTYKKWKELRSFLAQQYTRPKNDRTPKLDSLEEAANQMEQTLVKQSDKFRQEREKTDIKWQQVRDTLRQDEAALEIITYRHWDGEFSDTTRYAALLLTANAERPQFIPLCIEQKLDQLLEKDDDTRGAIFINDLYSYQGRGGDLYRLIWSKIDSFLQKNQTVYYSPSGLLHQISLKAIPHPEQTHLANRYNLARLNSTRKLVTGSPNPKHSSAAMFGGIEYDYEKDTIDHQKPQKEDLITRHDASTYNKRSIRGGFDYLSGSLEEVKAVSKAMPQTADITLKTGPDASEGAFKALGGNSPKLIHISTHGFFFADNPDSLKAKKIRSNKSIFRFIKDPLLRSGLLFAGSNYAWEQGHNPHEDEDGILTAKEIANMDLSNTDLVVLSACETGLGEVKGSEGVYGLQRAFKMAGVDYLIMSLWQVPDEETMMLMENFYDNWLSGESVRQAFRNAQQKLAEDYPPYFWAAFVMVGGGQEEPKKAGVTSFINGKWIAGSTILVLLIVIVAHRRLTGNYHS